MTPKQKKCLDVIRDFWSENEYAPSYDDLKDALGAKSKSSVAALVAKLAERGFITFIPRHARSIQLVAKHDPASKAGIVAQISNPR